jgi:hypothetical protein
LQKVYFMSSTARALPASAPARPLTPEASNVLAFWWLAIVTTIVLLCAMWPSIFGESGALASTGSYLITIISAVLVAIGIWCSVGFVTAQHWSARVMRLVTLIALGVGIAGVGFFLYSVAFAASKPNEPSFFGPSGVLGGVMWTLVIMLPFIFGLTLIFGLMNDSVDEWFNPPPAESVTQARLNVDPKTAALLAGSTGALSSQLGDEALMGELNEAMDLNTGSLRNQTGGLLDDQSIEVIGGGDDDMSVEVLSDGGNLDSDDSMAELAALEEALTEDASKKLPPVPKKKEEKKPTSGDEPLAVDDDFKL